MLLIVLVLSSWLSQLSFLAGASLDVCSQGHSKFPSLADADLEQLQWGLERHLFTSVELVETYLARISQVNDALHAVVEINPSALDHARLLDRERATGHLRSPLHGLPILLKNNIATADQMNTTAGSFALLGAKVPRDATVADRLRKAGAVLLGKTNLSQWACFRSSEQRTGNGWSAHGGQTYGPYLARQDPGGSSSGSAVAAAIGLSFAAIGTETHGSIVNPAEYNNVVGIKPTVGLVATDGVIPIAAAQDVVGPIARSVKDAAHLLHAIAHAQSSTVSKEETMPDYAAACVTGALRGKRFGVPQNVITATKDKIEDHALERFKESVARIEEAGGVIVNTSFLAVDEILESKAETTVFLSEFVSGLAGYFSGLTFNPNDIKSLEDMRKFTREFRDEDYPDRDTARFDAALALGFNASDPRHDDAVQTDESLGGPGGILGALERDRLDAVLLPTILSYAFTAIAGSPSITVPMGAFPAEQTVKTNMRGDLVDMGPNRPFGFSFLGRRFGEASLVSYAYSFEQLTRARQRIRPYVTPSAELKASK